MKGAETKHVREFRKKKLKPGETIVSFLEGWIGEMMGSGDKAQHNGMLIVSDQRVAFYRKGILGEVFETIPIAKLTSVEYASFMGHRVLTLHTSHDDLKFKTFESKEHFERTYEEIESRRESDGGSTKPHLETDDPICQLKKLGELKDAGIITEDEFAAKKRSLLSKI